MVEPGLKTTLGTALAYLGNPDPGDMKVYCPEGKETFDDAVPALAVLDRGQAANGDDSQASMWGSLQADRKNAPTRPLNQEEVLVPLPRTLPRQR